MATMISDYGKVCMERKTVLESLDDVRVHKFSMAHG